MVTLSCLHHANFTVSDMDRSLRFYRDLLGLTVIDDWISDAGYLARITAFEGAKLRLAFLALPGTEVRLELIQYLHPTAPPREPSDGRRGLPTNVPGAGHICFDVPDVREAYRELSARGVEFKSEPVEITSVANRGAWAVYLVDPDGITIELRQPPPGR